MISIRDKVRSAMGGQSLTVADVVRITGLSPDVVSTTLSDMKNKTKEVIYAKDGGGYGRYTLKVLPAYSGNMKQLESKLHQLTVNRERLRAMGISLIDSIIDDFEFFKSEFGLRK